jgi:hypothetical protein
MHSAEEEMRMIFVAVDFNLETTQVGNLNPIPPLALVLFSLRQNEGVRCM